MEVNVESDRIRTALDRYRMRSASFDAIAARRGAPPAAASAKAPPLPAELTNRELEVLRLAAEGYTSGKTAAALCLTEHTVKSHFKRIVVKIGAHNRAHAVAIGIRRGLIA